MNAEEFGPYCDGCGEAFVPSLPSDPGGDIWRCYDCAWLSRQRQIEALDAYRRERRRAEGWETAALPENQIPWNWTEESWAEHVATQGC